MAISKAAQKRAAKRAEAQREFKKKYPRAPNHGDAREKMRPDDIDIDPPGVILRPTKNYLRTGRYSILSRATFEYYGQVVIAPSAPDGVKLNLHTRAPKTLLAPEVERSLKRRALLALYQSMLLAEYGFTVDALDEAALETGSMKCSHDEEE